MRTENLLDRLMYSSTSVDSHEGEPTKIASETTPAFLPTGDVLQEKIRCGRFRFGPNPGKKKDSEAKVLSLRFSCGRRDECTASSAVAVKWRMVSRGLVDGFALLANGSLTWESTLP